MSIRATLHDSLADEITEKQHQANLRRAPCDEAPEQAEVVRILRLVEYVGDRTWVARTVSQALHGTRKFDGGQQITATTLTEFPESIRGKVISVPPLIWLTKEEAKILLGLGTASLVPTGPEGRRLLHKLKELVEDDL